MIGYRQDAQWPTVRQMGLQLALAVGFWDADAAIVIACCFRRFAASRIPGMAGNLRGILTLRAAVNTRQTLNFRLLSIQP